MIVGQAKRRYPLIRSSLYAIRGRWNMVGNTNHLDLDHLARLIRLRGYRNASLARAIGVEEWKIRRLLSGDSDPGWGLIIDIAQVLDVPSDDLICSTEQKIPSRSVKWQELSSIAALYQAFPGLTIYSECIKAPPMYVQPKEVHNWSFRSAQESIRWNEQ